MSRPRRRSLALSLVLLLLIAAVGVTSWANLRHQALAMARLHLEHRVAHPGWSFPAHVWSDSAPLDLPPARLALQARARGYVERCPPAAPGEFCAAGGEVLPRGGRFPEGLQPPGLDGWTRPPALEPVLIAVLVGPDGELREHLPLEEAPAALTAAIQLAEDEDFPTHHGIDLPGTLRAAWSNLRGGGFHQGASTLTMQVVRTFSEQRDKRLGRKLKEATSALVLDRALGKQAVLQAYLDAPYLGQAGSFSVCGFQAAARYYWGVDARDLSVAQAATLAAILPAPGRYSPDRHPEAAQARRDALLRRMGERGWDVAAALEEPLGATPHNLLTLRWPAYTQATRSWLEGAVSAEELYGAGLMVWTAMDVGVQEAGDRVLTERVPWIQKTLGLGGQAPILAAGVLLDVQSGLVVAAHDTGISASTGFSRVTQARRQPGSAFKPVVYALAMSQVGDDGQPLYTAATTVPNSPRVFKEADGWSPRNVAGEYTSTSCLAMGLAWSQNIATASLLERLGGPEVLIPFAQRVGFDTAAWPAEYGLALGQGEVSVLELARFTATVARGGELAPARPVLSATDAAGAERIPPPPPGEAVLSPEAAALTRDLMRLVVEYGTGGRARGTAGVAGYQGPMIGKTGTTDGERDLWFTGATPRYAGALWVGRDTPERIGVSASDFPAPLWGWWQRAVHDGLPLDEFGGVKLDHRGICTVSGLLPGPTCRVIPAPFLPGTAPRAACPLEHVPEPPKPEGTETWGSRWKQLAEEEAAALDEEQAAAAGEEQAAPAPEGDSEPPEEP
ncbi:MAG: transglycosylase domain-containing protein [Pseudomonadota bacterium]